MAQRMPLELYDMWSGYQTCCWRSLPFVEKNTWSDLEIGVDCTDTFSTWHFPPNGEPQKLDGVFSNSTIKDICFGKNWMTFFRKKTHGTSLVDPWVRPAMAAMLELPAEARRAWASMPCGDVMC